MAKILILKGDKPLEDSEAYKTYTSLTKVSRDHFDIIEYKDLIFKISNNNFEIYTYINGLKIIPEEYDLVYIRDYQGYEYERNCLAMYLFNKNVKYLNSDTGIFQHISKLTQYAVFSINDIPIPDSLFSSMQNIESLAPDLFGFPFIIKSIIARSGNDNYLIKSHNDLDAVHNKKCKYIAQRFVQNSGDYRVIVMGDKVTCVYLRKSGDNDHRNNISVGGKKEYIDLSIFPDEFKELSIKAAKILKREICGVDLMVNDVTGTPVILEANLNFGIRAIDGVVSDEIYGLAEYLHEVAET